MMREERPMEISLGTAVKGIVLLGVALLATGCGTPKAPSSFIQINDTTRTSWKTVELREGLTYEQAWQILVDTIAMKYDIETTDKDAGYLRSGWAYMTGKDQGTGYPFTYGRRLTCNFTEDKTKLQVKTEAYYQVQHYPTVYGLDSGFNEDVYTEIAGKLGRRTR